MQEKLELTLRQRQQRVLDLVRGGSDVRALNTARQLADLAERQLQQHHEAAYDRARQREAQACAERLAERRTPPSLQALVEANGTWDQITTEAWTTFDAEMAQWRDRLLGVSDEA